MIATILTFSLFGYSTSQAQDSTKAKMKTAKVMKKDAKGKPHKAIKKRL